MSDIIKFPLVVNAGRHAERPIRVGDPVAVRGRWDGGPLKGHVVEIYLTDEPIYIIATCRRRLVTGSDALDLVGDK